MRRLLSLFLLTLSFAACKHAFVLDIRSLVFDKNRPVIIGQVGDLLVTGLPDSALSITYDPADSSWSWQLLHPLYCKLNNKTQNALPLDSIVTIQVGTQSYSMQTLEKQLAPYAGNRSRVKYIGLREALEGCGEHPGEYKSVLAVNKADRKLILLDESIKVQLKDGRTVGYQRSGKLRAATLDINFFHVLSSVVLLKKGEKELYQVKDTTFYCAVKPLFTPFGASRITLTETALGNETALKAQFDKYYRVVIPAKAVDTLVNANATLPVSITQKMHASIAENELNVTNLSNNNTAPLATVDKSLTLTTTNPLLQNGDYRWTRTDKGVALDFLPLLLVYVFGIGMIGLITRDDIYEHTPNNDEKRYWRPYYLLLLTILFLLLLGRIVIGYNLSYTAPYFPFTLPTAVLVGPLLLLAVILCWCAFRLVRAGSAGFPSGLAIVFLVFFLVGYGWFARHQFPYYYDAFRTGFHWLAFANNDICYQTICALLVLLFILLVALLNDAWTKYVLLAGFLLFTISFMISGKNSYSVAVLLLVIGLLAGFANTKWAVLENRATFINRAGFVLGLIIVPLLIVLPAVALKNDLGYMINFLGFALLIIFATLWFYSYNPDADPGVTQSKLKKERTLSVALMVALLVLVSWTGLSIAHRYDPLNTSRFGSRMTAFFDFGTIRDFGTRASEQQAQFFAEVAPLVVPGHANAYDPIHPGISGFTDPVVKNDLSAPFGLISSFGKYWFVVVAGLILLWATLLLAVCTMTLAPFGLHRRDACSLTSYGLIRLYCVSVVVGSGLWLVASYYGVLPFTGRLIFGLGQDSMGEAFETVFLFAFMGLVAPHKSYGESKPQNV